MTGVRSGVAWVGAMPADHRGLPQVPVAGVLRGAWAVRRAGVRVALLTDGPDLAEAVMAVTLGGVQAALLAPEGPARALPRWERRFHRYLVRDQDTARAWTRAGVALGRIVVLHDDPHAEDALDAVLREVRSMAGRPLSR